MNSLQTHLSSIELEVGCDEAGRGCLAGPVVAAAVILPPGLILNGLNDSKKLTEKIRKTLAEVIKQNAMCYSIQFVDNLKIDEINILNASIEAMHLCISDLSIRPEHIIVDGNRFKQFEDIPHTTVIKGDSKFQTIAAASILAKTARDELMCRIHEDLPHYSWNVNKGYPTIQHKKAIEKYGLSPFHRKTFQHAITAKQLNLFD
ncbi:MAG: ribonuclease HII [Bacteroidota bacterium]